MVMQLTWYLGTVNGRPLHADGPAGHAWVMHLHQYYQPPAPPPPVVHYPVPVYVPMPVYVQPRRARRRPPPRRPVRRVVTYRRYRTNHGMHLWLFFCTGGLWALVWGYTAIINWLGPRQRTVTRYR